MRTAIAFLISLLAGMAFAQQDLKSYAPPPRTDAPTFVNAEVVRVNLDNTATFRSESGEITLTAEPANVGILGSLHAGDKVLVEYREARTADGRLTRYVTSVKPASPTSGEPGRARTVPARLTAGSTVRARVLSYDKGQRRVTVIDESGGLRRLTVRSRVTGLAALVPGSNVAFNLGAGTAGIVNVTGITPLGTQLVFAGGNAFPPINGQFVSFNPATSVVTIDTTTAGRLTFPVAATAASGFTALRRGDTLSVAFDVTEPTRASSVSGVQPIANVAPIPPVATVIGVQPLISTPATPVGTVPVATTTTTTTPTTVTVGTVAAPVVTGAVVPNSPYTSTVPSIPAATARPVPGVVLPPAGAKEPLSAEDVGLMRTQGERDLDAAAVALAAAAASIDALWAGFKDQCLRGVTVPTVTAGREWYLLAEDRIPTPADDSCRAMHTDLTARTEGFLSQLETVQDAARKADVLPARVREVLDRHKL